MRQEWVAILVTLVVLVVGLATLLRIVLRSSRHKPFALPQLPDGRVLFPIGSLFAGNDEVAATEVSALLSPNSKILLALLYEVPRAIALEQAEPEEATTALLGRIQQTITTGGHAHEYQIIPCRNALEEVLRLIGNQQATAVFVRLDALAETDSARILLERATCTVLLSHGGK